MKVYNFKEEKDKRYLSSEAQVLSELSELTGRSIEAIKCGYSYKQDKAWDLFLYILTMNTTITLKETLEIIKRELIND